MVNLNLDELAAIHLMEWHRGNKGNELPDFWYDKKGEVQAFAADMKQGRAWSPSTNLAEAFILVQQLHESPVNCKFGLTLIPHMPTLAYFIAPGNDKPFFSECLGPARAITIAALKVKGITFNE